MTRYPFSSLTVVLLAGTLAGCGSNADVGDDRSGVNSGRGNQGTGGDRVVPASGGARTGTGGGPGVAGGSTGGVVCGSVTCAPGQECCNPSCGTCVEPGGACTQQLCEPEPVGVQCGDVTCAPGQECCNPSCGICVEPGGVCTQQICEGECTRDADCRLVDDYCEGCNCHALAPGESPPVCTGEQVACFVAPCELKSAACVDGQCVAR